MFHHSMPMAERDGVKRCDLYSIAMAVIVRYPSLCMVEYIHTTSVDIHQLVIGFTNGVRLLHLKSTPRKFRAALVDSTLRCPLEHGNQTELVESANARYIAATLTQRGKTAAEKLKSAIDDRSQDLKPFAYEILSRVTSAQKASEPSAMTMTSSDIYELSRVINNKVDKLDINVSLLSKIDSFTTKYDEYCTKRDSYNGDMQSMFGREKWVIGVSKHEQSTNCLYHVMAINAAPLIDSLTGIKTLYDYEWQPTLAMDSYRSLDHMPEPLRSELLGSLTMLKVFRKANYSLLPDYDKDGYFAANSSYIFQPNVGWMQSKALRHVESSGLIMLLDK